MRTDSDPANLTASGSCAFWCERDIYYGEGADRHLWHQRLLAEYDHVTISLVQPHGEIAGYPDAPQWRLEIHGEEVRLPESFSTWTVLDLMWAVEEAADALEDLLQAVPDGDTDFESLEYAGSVASDDSNGLQSHQGVDHD